MKTQNNPHEKYTREQRQKITAAHATAEQLTATIWPNWPHAIPSTLKKSKKVYVPRTPKFKVARGFKAGHGRYS
jgi:hypothetical protein